MQNPGTSHIREQLVDNEWYQIVNMKKFQLECCDCGLVHDVSWKRKGKKLAMKVARNEKETNKIRMEIKDYVA